MRVTIGVEGGGILRRRRFWSRWFKRKAPAVVVLRGGALPEAKQPGSPLEEEVRAMLGRSEPLRVRMPEGNYPSFRAAYARGELVARAIDRSTEPPTIIFESAG